MTAFTVLDVLGEDFEVDTRNSPNQIAVLIEAVRDIGKVRAAQALWVYTRGEGGYAPGSGYEALFKACTLLDAGSARLYAASVSVFGIRSRLAVRRSSPKDLTHER